MIESVRRHIVNTTAIVLVYVISQGSVATLSRERLVYVTQRRAAMSERPIATGLRRRRD